MYWYDLFEIYLNIILGGVNSYRCLNVARSFAGRRHFIEFRLVAFYRYDVSSFFCCHSSGSVVVMNNDNFKISNMKGFISQQNSENKWQ